MNRETALRELSHGQPELRRRAARVLGRWSDDQVLGALTGALQSPDRGIREAATDTLLEIGDARTVRLLLPLLRSATPSTRNSARLLLQRLAQAAPDLLIDLARDPEVRMRIFAANIMAESGDHDLSGPLLELLDDADENVRDAAVVGLGRLGAPEAVRRLEAFASEGASWTRFSAIDALSQIVSAEATRALLRLLEHASPELQEPVVDALGRQGSPEAIVPLIQKMNASAALAPAIAAVLVDSLAAEIPSRAKDVDRASFARALARALEEGGFGPERTVAALDLFAELGVPDEGACVTRLLTSPEPAVQGAAIRAAHTLRLAGAIPVLRGLEELSDPTLAKEIQAVLASLGAPRKESL